MSCGVRSPTAPPGPGAPRCGERGACRGIGPGGGGSGGPGRRGPGGPGRGPPGWGIPGGGPPGGGTTRVGPCGGWFTTGSGPWSRLPAIRDGRHERSTPGPGSAGTREHDGTSLLQVSRHGHGRCGNSNPRPTPRRRYITRSNYTRRTRSAAGVRRPPQRAPGHCAGIERDIEC
ncbi:hypothetical protein CA982_10020 [Gordonia lacunae]|uniref:Uncharacterized protein n=1 Tax=Gordonia lacunae TaxID=417102 RepID=A0A243QCK1_9ACTN|nr:hypothetical protein CA982_10020 [Gordonia lacunae]